MQLFMRHGPATGRLQILGQTLDPALWPGHRDGGLRGVRSGGETPRLTGTVAAHLRALATQIGTVGSSPGNELLPAYMTSHATLSTHLHSLNNTYEQHTRSYYDVPRG